LIISLKEKYNFSFIPVPVNTGCKRFIACFLKQIHSHIITKIIAVFVVIICISIFHTSTIEAQNNNASVDNKDEKIVIDEWKEIFKLRSAFASNKYGSRYVLGVFDGRFIGPNNEDNYGLRTYTTAYDYLILGNSFLSILINLGFTADKINFLPAKSIANHHSYTLGCIAHYAITEDKYRVDSVFNATIGKNVAVDKPYTSTIPRLGIDSGYVVADLAGFYIRQKVDKKTIYDTVVLPQVEGTGSWKDANNFDLAYEWLETFYLQYCDSIDISTRQFSKNTPPEIQQCILQRFNTKKYLKKNNLTEDKITYRLRDNYKNDIYDIVHQPNEKILRLGNYELFKYFNDVYWRDLNETTVMKGRGRNEAGEPVSYSYVWKPGDSKNPVWHNAFQYDKDMEKNPGTGLINYVMLPYGTKDRNMPTVVPNDLKPFSQFEGVVIWKEGCEKQTYSNKDDIRINTLNGRMINQGFFAYPCEKGIMPLNDDGSVDGIYKIYVWKDDKEYWAYIYCGKHAAVRGGKPGKSFVSQVESFRKNYDFSDYWYFYKNLDFKKDVAGNMNEIIGKLQSLERHESGIAGKTKLKIDIPITRVPDSKKPNKTVTDYYYILLNNDKTGTLYPQKLNFTWKIETYDDYKNNMLVKKRSVIIDIAGKEIPLEEFDEFVKTADYSASEVKKVNKEFTNELESMKNTEPAENLNEIYNNNLYNLGNSDETSKLIDIIKEDLAAVRYEIPKAEKTLTSWQDANSEKMNELKKTLDELEKDKKTKKDTYIKTKEEFEKLKQIEDKKVFQYNKLMNRENVLVELLKKCNERLDVDLDNDLAVIQSKISFLTSERNKYEQQLKQLKADGKSGTEYYQQLENSINNKKQELAEAEDKKSSLQKLIQIHKNSQSVE